MELTLGMVVGSLFAIGMRVGGLMLFTPFLSHGSISPRTKAALTAALTLLLYPVLGNQAIPQSATGWALLAVHETMIGLTLGLALRIVFEGMQLAGQLLGFQLGFSLVNVIDPQTQVDMPVLSMFTQLISLVVFLQLEIHHWVLRGIGKSFEYLPVGQSIAAGALTEIIQAAGGIFLIAVQIAAPVLIATFLADIAVGFVAKASPQLPVLFLAIPVKSLLGFTIIVGVAPYWVGMLDGYFLDALSLMERVLQLD